MSVFIKILNTILILFAVFMGIKQGWAMVTGKAVMLEMFAKWNLGKNGVMALGVVTIISAVMVLIPRTFLWGNFIMATTILFIMALELQHQDLKGAAIEVPFFLLSLVIIYLKYPVDIL